MFYQLIAYVTAGYHDLRTRPAPRRNRDGGYSTEAILVTALLVVIAIAAVAIISTKVLAKVNGITL